MYSPYILANPIASQDTFVLGGTTSLLEKNPMARFLTLLLMVALPVFGLMACQEEAPATAPVPAPAPQPATPSQSLAVADIDRVYQESNLGMTANQLLNDMNTKLQAELIAFQTAHEGNLTEAQAELLQQGSATYRGIMQAAVKQLEEQMESRVTEILSNYRQQNDLAIVLKKDQALSYGMEIDITEKILEIVNASPMDMEVPALKESGNIFPEEVTPVVPSAGEAGNASDAAQ